MPLQSDSVSLPLRPPWIWSLTRKSSIGTNQMFTNGSGALDILNMRHKSRVCPLLSRHLISLWSSPTAHKIQGDSLCVVDSESLKSLGIISIGQRLSILKSIYLVKLAQSIPFNEDDYIPPCSSNICPMSYLAENECPSSWNPRTNRQHFETPFPRQKPRWEMLLF